MPSLHFEVPMAVTSSEEPPDADVLPLLGSGSMDNELFASRIITTGSPAFRCISVSHFLGSDKM